MTPFAAVDAPRRVASEDQVAERPILPPLNGRSSADVASIRAGDAALVRPLRAP